MGGGGYHPGLALPCVLSLKREFLHLMGIFSRSDRSKTAPDTGLARELEELQAQVRRIRSRLDELEETASSDLESMDDRLKVLTIAIEEGIERVDRSERRVRAVVQRAQRRFADEGYVDAGIEAEAAHLQHLDEGERGAEGMQTVHEGLDERGPAFDPTGIPGTVTPDILEATRLNHA